MIYATQAWVEAEPTFDAMRRASVWLLEQRYAGALGDSHVGLGLAPGNTMHRCEQSR